MKKLLIILGILILLMPLAYAKTLTNVTATPGVRWMIVTCPWENLQQDDGIITCTAGGTVEEKQEITPMQIGIMGIIIIGIIYYLKKKKKI